MMQYLFVLAMCWLGANGQFTSISSCDTIQNGMAAASPFDLVQFSGLWYEIARVDNPYQGECTTASFANMDQTLVVHYEDLLHSVTVNATRAASETTGKFTVNVATISYPIWVLITDYTNYALIYSCSPQVGVIGSEVSMSKMARNMTLSTEHLAAINAKLSSIAALKDVTFRSVSHSEDICGAGDSLKGSSLIVALLVAVMKYLIY